MRKRLTTLTTVAVAATIAFQPSTAAPVAAEVAERRAAVVRVSDPAGDVRVLPATGPSRAARETIDLLGVTIRPAGARLRFTFRLADVRPRLRFDQMAFVEMRPATSSGSDSEGAIGLSSKERFAYAYWGSSSNYEDFASCDPLRSVSLPLRDVMYLDVPRRCLPDERVRLSISTVAGTFRSDASMYSRDRVATSGLIDLQALFADS